MKLPRPHIPLGVRVTVAERQMQAQTGCVATDAYGVPLSLSGASMAARLKAALFHLSAGGAQKMHLDHHPALENREKLVESSHGLRRWVMVVPKWWTVIRYRPDANDPAYLFYREKQSHHIKTGVRGDGAQFADNVIAARERRRRRKKLKRWRRNKIPSRKNPWPPKGSRKLLARR